MTYFKNFIKNIFELRGSGVESLESKQAPCLNFSALMFTQENRGRKFNLAHTANLILTKVKKHDGIN